MTHGLYIGKNDPYLAPKIGVKTDRRVLLRKSENKGMVLAQFDNTKFLSKEYTHAWVEFPESDFVIEPEEIEN